MKMGMAVIKPVMKMERRWARMGLRTAAGSFADGPVAGDAVGGGGLSLERSLGEKDGATAFYFRAAHM